MARSSRHPSSAVTTRDKVVIVLCAVAVISFLLALAAVPTGPHLDFRSFRAHFLEVDMAIFAVAILGAGHLANPRRDR